MSRYHALMSAQQIARAEQRVRTRRRPRKHPDQLIAYAAITEPTWDWDAAHLRFVATALDNLTDGARVCLEIPIRHGKSELATIRWAAHLIIKNPAIRILIGCNNDVLARSFSRAIRRLVIRAGVELSADENTQSKWRTIAGGGVRAAGIGAGTAGETADVVIIDDPIANRAQSESSTERETVFESITNDFLARLQPTGIAVLTMSRWHQDDPIGRIRDGRLGAHWQFIRLPGEAEKNDPLGRAEGEALWPAFWPLDKLLLRKLDLGAIGYAGLIQQLPQPKGGSMFKWEWWQVLPVAPAVTGYLYRYWDTAGTEPRKGMSDPDYTVGVLLGRMLDDRFVVLDVCRIRASIARRDAEMQMCARRDRDQWGPGRVRWRIEQPTGQGGYDSGQALLRLLAGTNVEFDSPRGDKITRADPMASYCEGGLICLAPGDWHDDFRSEFSAFPRGKHDDQVDAMVGAFSHLAFPGGDIVISTYDMG